MEAYARKNNLPLNWEPPQDAMPHKPGAEHDVWQSKDGTRYYKRTIPIQEDPSHPDARRGQTGLTIEVHPDDPDDWGLRPGTPASYIERFGVMNKHFGDDIKPEGLWRDSRSEGWHIATSQKARIPASDPTNPVSGSKPDAALAPDKHPTETEMHEFMIGKGFVPVPRMQTLRNGTSVPDYRTWYHPDTHIVAADIKANNFVKTAQGVSPVDMVLRDLSHPQDAGAQALRNLMEKRMAPRDPAQIRALLNLPEPKPSPPPSLPGDPNPSSPKDLPAAPLALRRSRLKGRAVLNHLLDHVPATPQERYALLRQAVAVYQSLYPALWRRFRRGSTSGRSGLETQFREASGRITPESVRHARIFVQEDKLATDLRGLSPRQTVFHMEHALGEEVRHLASLQAALALWERSGTRLSLDEWLTGYFSHLWQHAFASPLRTAILHAYAGNYGDPTRGNKMAYLPQDWQLAFEGLRMLSQARAGILLTEADQLWHWPQHDRYPLPMLIYFIQQAALSGQLSPSIEWMLHAMDQCMRAWHQPAARQRSGFRGQRSGLNEMQRAA